MSVEGLTQKDFKLLDELKTKANKEQKEKIANLFLGFNFQEVTDDIMAYCTADDWQSQFCRYNNLPKFSPSTCWHCNKSPYQNKLLAASTHITGCFNCKRSFVD